MSVDWVMYALKLPKLPDNYIFVEPGYAKNEDDLTLVNFSDSASWCKAGIDKYCAILIRRQISITDFVNSESCFQELAKTLVTWDNSVTLVWNGLNSWNCQIRDKHDLPMELKQPPTDKPEIKLKLVSGKWIEI